jgi:hypothetical protein
MFSGTCPTAEHWFGRPGSGSQHHRVIPIRQSGRCQSEHPVDTRSIETARSGFSSIFSIFAVSDTSLYHVTPSSCRSSSFGPMATLRGSYWYLREFRWVRSDLGRGGI